VILMRVTSEKPQVRWQRLRAAITRFQENMQGRYVVIEDARFRVRPMRETTSEK
jgi:hypothetical protein